MGTAAPLPNATAAAVAALPSPEQLPDDPAILKQMILELLATLRQERGDIEALRQRIDYLLRRLYGPRNERFDPNQPLLFTELNNATTAASETPPSTESAASLEPDSVEASKKKPKPAPHGRRTFPACLPREPRDYELTAAERVCTGCGATRVDMGFESSEQVDYRPATLFVIEHRVHKYVCPCCSAAALSATATTTTDAATTAAPSVPEAPSRSPVILLAPKPPQPIAKGMPGPGLLAHLIVSKYVDHLPLHRLERIYDRQGLVLPRSTTCDWLAACTALLRPLCQRMIDRVLQSRVIHTDDTPVKIHDPPPGATDKGRMWVYLGDAAHPYNVFDFTPNRERIGPQTFLAQYRGFLQADAYTGYDGLYLPRAEDTPYVFEVACNAHARRRFHEARTSDALGSHQALAYYRQLYEIETRAKKLNADEALRLKMRQDLAKPILEKFERWLREQKDQVLPKSPMGEAISYALNNWTALVRYTEHGFLAIDNNVAEREMKRIAIGRKNWLFVGSEKGGHTAAVLFSFTATCHRLGVEPWAYLRDVLTRLPTTPAEQLDDLLPDRWQAAHAANTTTADSAS